jgi:hypothetical protein
MSSICIQIQSNRARDIDMLRVRELCEYAASNNDLVLRFAVLEGEEKGLFINLTFETTELQKMWFLLQDLLFRDEKIGAALTQSSIVVCEGKDGWNDYLVLHHFNPSEKLDNIEAR